MNVKYYLDGGMGTTLLEMGAFKHQQEFMQLWSLAPLLDKSRHSFITKAHQSFLQAGATVLTTNTYACTNHIIKQYTPPSKDNDGVFNAQETLNTAIADAVQLAQRARGTQSNVSIAGALPPLQDSYCPTQVLNATKMMSEYENMVRIMSENKVDVLLCETMSCIQEAYCALHACQTIAPHLPVWMSFTVKENCQIRSGETLDKVCDVLGNHVHALLINCSTPQECTDALVHLSKLRNEHTKKNNKTFMIGVYPNTFHTIDTNAVWCEHKSHHEHTAEEAHGILPRQSISNTQWKDYIQQWNDSHVNIVGGCCGMNAQTMQYIYEQLDYDV